MTARFRPKGLFGLLYWSWVLPLHAIVFGGMLRGIRRTAETAARAALRRSSRPDRQALNPIRHSSIALTVVQRDPKDYDRAKG